MILILYMAPNQSMPLTASAGTWMPVITSCESGCTGPMRRTIVLLCYRCMRLSMWSSRKSKQPKVNYWLFRIIIFEEFIHILFVGRVENEVRRRHWLLQVWYDERARRIRCRSHCKWHIQLRVLILIIDGGFDPGY